MTPKQQRFAEEYLVDLNATQAAIRAGYSKTRACARGWKLLRQAEVAAAIEAEMSRRAARTAITADRVLIELARIAFADPRDCVTWGPNGVEVKSSDELSSDAAGAVAEVSGTRTKSGGTTKIKMHDKIAALEKIGRHLGLFKDRLEMNGSGRLPELNIIIVHGPEASP